MTLVEVTITMLPIEIQSKYLKVRAAALLQK